MLMQTNANLFAISVEATQKVIAFFIGDKIYHNFYAMDDWEFNVIENGCNIGLTPDIHKVDEEI